MGRIHCSWTSQRHITSRLSTLVVKWWQTILNYMIKGVIHLLKLSKYKKFINYTEGFEIQFGFITPGHGMKGKQTDEELETTTKRSGVYINLWLKCKPKSKKRASPDGTSGDSSQSKQQNSLLEMMNEVDVTVRKSIYACWAHNSKVWFPWHSTW